jgi:hypothetical protein
MKKVFVILFFISLSACNANLSNDELETKLKNTMTDFLYKEINYDSSKIRYYIKDVVFYNDNVKNSYDCEFKVSMSIKGQKDTVGRMFAYISKDFKDVKRKY